MGGEKPQNASAGAEATSPITPARRRQLDVDGWTVSVSDTDLDDERIPLVLVHGTGGDAASNFGAVMPGLAVRHRVVGVDLDADDGRRLEVEDLIEQVVAAIQSVAGGRSVVLVGHSLGSLVCACVAARRPDLVRALVLLAGWVRSDGARRLRTDVWWALYRHDHETLKRFLVFTAFSDRFLAAKRPDEIAALTEARAWRPGTGAQMELTGRLDISAELGRIEAPTLVIGGRYDQTAPFAHSRALFDGIGDARLVGLPSGHAVATECAAQVVGLVAAFATDPAVLPSRTVVSVDRD